MCEIAICLDGPGLVDAAKKEWEAAGWRVSGQAVRRDGMPVVFISKVFATAESARLMRKRLAAAYGVAA